MCYQIFQGLLKIPEKLKLKQYFLNPVVLEAMQPIHCISVYRIKSLFQYMQMSQNYKTSSLLPVV